jgi:hypothetical protein
MRPSATRPATGRCTFRSLSAGSWMGERLKLDACENAFRAPRTPKTRHQQRCSADVRAKYVSSDGNRDALRRMEGRQASGRSPVDPPEPAVAFAQPQARLRRGASAVGSASRARSVHRRSQAVGEVGLSEPPKSDALPALAPASLVDASRPRAFARSRMAPSVRRRSSPQPQEGADA